MGIVFLSPSVAAPSSQGNFFFLLPLGLRFPQDFFSAHRSTISIVTNLVLEPDIDQRQADQEADLRGFDHGGRGVLMP
nr:hypothetical protein CFP56_59792 [Quercus suber]